MGDASLVDAWHSASTRVPAGPRSGSSSWRCQRSRLIRLVRSLTRSSRWSTSSRSSRVGPSRWAAGRSGSAQRGPGDRQRVDRVRLAVGAGRVRAWAISFGGTRTIRSPAREQIRFQPPRQCRQSSTAHCRSRAEALRPSAASPDVAGRRRRRRLDGRAHGRASSTATTVWVRLCASIPNVTMDAVAFHL